MKNPPRKRKAPSHGVAHQKTHAHEHARRRALFDWETVEPQPPKPVTALDRRFALAAPREIDLSREASIHRSTDNAIFAHRIPTNEDTTS